MQWLERLLYGSHYDQLPSTHLLSYLLLRIKIDVAVKREGKLHTTTPSIALIGASSKCFITPSKSYTPFTTALCFRKKVKQLSLRTSDHGFADRSRDKDWDCKSEPEPLRVVPDGC